MANRVNNWQELLKLANKDLEKHNIEISVLFIGTDGTYDILIDNNCILETFASRCYEDELGNFINEAWAHARTKAKLSVEKLVEAYLELTDAEKDEFLRLTENS